MALYIAVDYAPIPLRTATSGDARESGSVPRPQKNINLLFVGTSQNENIFVDV